MSAIERLRAAMEAWHRGASPGAVAELVDGALDEHDAIVADRDRLVGERDDWKLDATDWRASADRLRADRDRLAARVAELEGAALVAESVQREEDLASIGADPCPVNEETIDRWAHGELDAVRVGDRGWALEHAEGKALAMQVARLTRQVEAMRGRGL